MHKLKLKTDSFEIAVNPVVHFFYIGVNFKQLLDEVFVMCGIIKVEVRVISRAEEESIFLQAIDEFCLPKNLKTMMP